MHSRWNHTILHLGLSHFIIVPNDGLPQMQYGPSMSSSSFTAGERALSCSLSKAVSGPSKKSSDEVNDGEVPGWREEEEEEDVAMVAMSIVDTVEERACDLLLREDEVLCVDCDEAGKEMSDDWSERSIGREDAGEGETEERETRIEGEVERLLVVWWPEEPGEGEREGEAEGDVPNESALGEPCGTGDDMLPMLPLPDAKSSAPLPELPPSFFKLLLELPVGVPALSDDDEGDRDGEGPVLPLVSGAGSSCPNNSCIQASSSS